MALGGELVGGVHLYGEVGVGVDKLYQQREGRAVAGDGAAAQQGLAAVGGKLGQGAAGDGGRVGHALLAGHGRDFPAFADGFLCGVDALECGHGRAAPYHGVQTGREVEYVG